MAILGQPYDPDVIRQLVDRQAVLERRVADLEGRRLLTTDRRSSTSDIVDPVEGQLVTVGAVVYAYTNGAWRPTSGCFEIKVFDDATTVSTGDGMVTVEIPPDMDGTDLVFVRAYVTTVSSSGTPTVQIRNVTQTADMLSTRVTIDANAKSSKTATAAYVIDTGNDDVSDGDQIAVDVDVAGTGAKGLGVILRFA